VDRGLKPGGESAGQMFEDEHMLQSFEGRGGGEGRRKKKTGSNGAGPTRREEWDLCQEERQGKAIVEWNDEKN